MNFLFNTILMYTDWAVSFRDSATPIMEGIVDLHNHITFYLIVIFIFVSWMLASIIYYFYYRIRFPVNKEELMLRYYASRSHNVVHGTFLEIIWTIIPSLILIFIVVPSFALLYSMDEVIDPALTLKVIGHQWYWSYEYDNTVTFKVEGNDPVSHQFVLHFDSYLIDESELEFGTHRLLEVDNQVVLPVDTHIRVVVTADDVLHSWAIPSLGVKMDAVPGRLSQIFLFIKREGTFYGQCSELCGVDHGYMPIAIKAVSADSFIDWYAVSSSN